MGAGIKTEQVDEASIWFCWFFFIEKKLFWNKAFHHTKIINTSWTPKGLHFSYFLKRMKVPNLYSCKKKKKEKNIEVTLSRPFVPLSCKCRPNGSGGQGCVSIIEMLASYAAHMVKRGLRRLTTTNVDPTRWPRMVFLICGAATTDFMPASFCISHNTSIWKNRSSNPQIKMIFQLQEKSYKFAVEGLKKHIKYTLLTITQTYSGYLGCFYFIICGFLLCFGFHFISLSIKNK